MRGGWKGVYRPKRLEGRAGRGGYGVIQRGMVNGLG